MAEIRKRSSKKTSLLKVSLRGSDIERSGAVPVPLLVEVCKALQSAVSKQAELEGADGVSPEEYTLELVRLGKGSAVLEFELVRSQEYLSGQLGLGERAVMSVVGLVHDLGDRKKPIPSESEVSNLKAMAKVVGPNLRIALHVPKERTHSMETVKATFNAKVAERVDSLSLKEVQFVPQVLEGIVEMADFKPSDQKFRLVTLYGQSLICEFEESISSLVHQLTRAVARVSGVAEIDPQGKIVSFRVDKIAPRGSPMPEGFWEKKTLAQLIAEQKVKPIKTISELKGIWPEHEPKPN
jgi:hypothetical protein